MKETEEFVFFEILFTNNPIEINLAACFPSRGKNDFPIDLVTFCNKSLTRRISYRRWIALASERSLFEGADENDWSGYMWREKIDAVRNDLRYVPRNVEEKEKKMKYIIASCVATSENTEAWVNKSKKKKH